MTRVAATVYALLAFASAIAMQADVPRERILNIRHADELEAWLEDRAVAEHGELVRAFVACRSGQRSMPVCSKLRKQGFASVYNLAGGVQAWQKAGSLTAPCSVIRIAPWGQTVSQVRHLMQRSGLTRLA